MKYRITLKNPDSDDIELKPLDDRIARNVVGPCLGRYETVIVRRCNAREGGTK